MGKAARGQMRWVRPNRSRRDWSNAMRGPEMNAFSKVLLAGTIATTLTSLTDAALARYLEPSQVDLI
jgi:hypothetical protein